MPDWVVTTAFRGKDEMSAAFKSMGAGANRFGKKASRSFKKAANDALSFKKIVGGVLTAGLLQKGIGQLNRGIEGTIDNFIRFDHAATLAAAKFPEGIKRGTREFKELKKVARDVGATTQFTATQAAEGLDFLAMAGFDSKQAMESLPRIVDLATVANMDLARSTDIASDALGSFNLMTKDSAQLSKNLARINDVFAKTVVTANTDMEQLFETMKKSGPVVTASGHEIETFAAIAGKMASSGIKAGDSATAMKNMFLRLQAPVGKGATLLKKLNIQTQDSSGNFRDIFDILEDFNKATREMGTAQRSAALDTIFGKRAIAGVSILLNEGSDSLRKYRELLKQAGGEAGKMSKDIRDSLQNRLESLNSAALELGFKFLDAFASKFPDGIDGAIAAVRKFDVSPIVFEIKNIGKTVKEMVNNTKKLIEDYKGVFVALGTVIAGIKIHALATAITGTLIPAIKGAMVAIGPLGWAILGVSAAVTSAIVHSEDLGRAFGWLADDISEFVSDSWASLKRFFRWILEKIPLVGESLSKMISTDDISTGIERGLRKAAKPKLEMDLAKEAMKTGVPKAAKSQIKLAQEALNRGTLLAKKGTPARKMQDEFARLQQKYAVAPSDRIPPSQTEKQSKQAITFDAKMTFENAPKGAKVESKTRGAPPIKTEMLGANI
jgi:TP901 family phage tail tape measure protein